jgi:hypothetical protein
MDWLKSLVPVLGTALGGPLGGAAAAFIAKKLGIADETVEAVSEVLNSGKLSPEQISALKLAEIDFQKFLEGNKIKLEEIHAGDRNSARDMQATTRSKIPGCLAIIIVAGFFAILVGLMSGVLNVADSQALLILLGALSAGFGAVLNFYYGSSAGSQNKDILLAQSGPLK